MFLGHAPFSKHRDHQADVTLSELKLVLLPPRPFVLGAIADIWVFCQSKVSGPLKEAIGVIIRYPAVYMTSENWKYPKVL